MYYFKKTNELDYRLYTLLKWFNAHSSEIFVSNAYLCDKLHVSTRTLQRSLTRLKNDKKIEVINSTNFKRQILIIPTFIESKKIDIPDYNWLDN